ncbi:MAG TPA: polysaccharide deacetylase family protein, partial [Methylomirabilota bacterium]
MRLPRDRFDYSPIAHRRPWTLPKGARIAVWTIVNIEEWDIEKVMARQYLTAPQGVATVPDVPNWAWHDYGMRVGFWRFLEVLGARKLKATFAVNGTACELYREACQAALDAGWEFMGHGFVQRPMHRVEDQGAAIRDT